jgi:hypothetical protein
MGLPERQAAAYHAQRALAAADRSPLREHSSPRMVDLWQNGVRLYNRYVMPGTVRTADVPLSSVSVIEGVALPPDTKIHLRGTRVGSSDLARRHELPAGETFFLDLVRPGPGREAPTILPQFGVAGTREGKAQFVDPISGLPLKISAAEEAVLVQIANGYLELFERGAVTQ